MKKFLSFHQGTVHTTLSRLKQNNPPPLLQAALVPEDWASLFWILKRKLTLHTNYRNKNKHLKSTAFHLLTCQYLVGQQLPHRQGAPPPLTQVPWEMLHDPNQELPCWPQHLPCACRHISLSHPVTHLRNRSHWYWKDMFQVWVPIKWLWVDLHTKWDLSAWLHIYVYREQV